MNIIFDDLGIDQKIKAYKRGIKSEMQFKFPNILSVIDAHCYAHNIDYEEETHQLPTGNTYKTKCSKCSKIEKDSITQTEIEKYLKDTKEEQEIAAKHNLTAPINKKSW